MPMIQTPVLSSGATFLTNKQKIMKKTPLSRVSTNQLRYTCVVSRDGRRRSGLLLSIVIASSTYRPNPRRCRCRSLPFAGSVRIKNSRINWIPKPVREQGTLAPSVSVSGFYLPQAVSVTPPQLLRDSAPQFAMRIFHKHSFPTPHHHHHHLLSSCCVPEISHEPTRLPSASTSNV